ncbi:hypothetical protein KP509_15G054800 [Ceratopteris richardii]|nr:hypothetical protein KP509_15G054800 [Ceratopteris richardii]
MSNIKSRTTLETKIFTIPKIVYPNCERDILHGYIEKQLKLARDVITEDQAGSILQLIMSGVAEGSMMKKEIGGRGSLKSSLSVALLREEGGHIHFSMVATSIEPRLGWRFISKDRRNIWNEVLIRAAENRMKQELGSLSTVMKEKRVIKGKAAL